MRQRLLVIAGPTASGKSALALEVAERAGGELVSADSQQVYRHFDIGTAKPSAEELARVPHHLVSVAEPHEQFSAARWAAEADAVIEDIVSRGKVPIVVGGTGLYLRFLLHGTVPAPPADKELRAALEAEAETHGRAALHERLRAIDPETAAKVQPTDLVRIVRALEIHALTGRTASDFRREHAFGEDRYDHVLVALDPPRDALYRAIEQRTGAMFAAGLADEVRLLVERGYRDSPPMASVGYVQALAYVEGRLSLADAIAEAAKQTRHYAKRQWTWFRRERDTRFLSPPYDVAALVELARLRSPEPSPSPSRSH